MHTCALEYHEATSQTCLLAGFKHCYNLILLKNFCVYNGVI